MLQPESNGQAPGKLVHMTHVPHTADVESTLCGNKRKKKANEKEIVLVFFVLRSFKLTIVDVLFLDLSVNLNSVNVNNLT